MWSLFISSQISFYQLLLSTYQSNESGEFVNGSQYETQERRRRPEWSGEVFWVVLHSRVVGVDGRLQFHDFHPLVVNITANELHSGRLKLLD